MATLFHDYWSSFREEIIATSLVLIVAVGGSFFVLHRVLNPPLTSPEIKISPDQEVAQTSQAIGELLGTTQTAVESQAEPLPTPLPLPSAVPTPTTGVVNTEVFFGIGGQYEDDAYKLSINSPRLSFDPRDPSSRKFVVDIVLENKSVAQGIPNSITASIIKDGTVIVKNAAMSVTEAKVVMPGESLSFQARISLIESTDVSTLYFQPPGLAPVTHVLNP